MTGSVMMMTSTSTQVRIIEMEFFRRLTKKTRSNETGLQNAERFVTALESLAERHRLIEMFPHPGFHGVKGEQYEWVWMPNVCWRDVVKHLIQERKSSVRDVQFHAPDSMDGWTFSAISTTPLPRVAHLSLDETL